MEAKTYTEKELVLRYKDMADKILLARFKEKYYMLAMEHLKAIKTPDKETEKLRQELEYAINEAKARMVIEKYDFACKSREYAKTSEDLGSAALHYKEAAEALAEIPVDEDMLGEESLKKYNETKMAEEMAKACEKKSVSTYQIGRVKFLGMCALAVAVVLGLAVGSKTSTYRIALGKCESLLGMHGAAAKEYKKAYDRHSSKKTYELYLSALYKDGKNSFASGDMSRARTQLQLPADEGYEDAEAFCTVAELSLMQELEAGDSAYFSGTKWNILNKEGSLYTMIRVEGMNGGSFKADTADGFTWDVSDLRTYLNTTYYDQEFTPSEKEHVVLSQVSADDNVIYGTSAGENTEDYVYLLSAAEYTEYKSDINDCKRNAWLRTPGASAGTMTYVDPSKKVMDYGYEVTTDAFYMKPVITIDASMK